MQADDLTLDTVHDIGIDNDRIVVIDKQADAGGGVRDEIGHQFEIAKIAHGSTIPFCKQDQSYASDDESAGGFLSFEMLYPTLSQKAQCFYRYSLNNPEKHRFFVEDKKEQAESGKGALSEKGMRATLAFREFSSRPSNQEEAS